MKIGVISDTHGDLVSAEKAIRLMGDIDILIHAGDTFRDAMLIKEKTGIEVIAVKGNTDFDCEADIEKVISIGKKRIFLTHGHAYNVKFTLDRLYYKALETNSDIVIFGHSHMQTLVNEKDITFLNPGSVSRPRGGKKPSYAIIDVIQERFEIKLYDLD